MLQAATSKTCRVCSRHFAPFLSTATVCSPRCSAKVGRIARKAEREQTKARKDALRPLSYWAKQAQTAFNAWIRWRDRDLPCISCRTTKAVQWHAGHFLSVGARPELRFEEANVHKQCSQCNDYLSGNANAYRTGLLKRHGLSVVEWLEGWHEPKRYRADDLKAITATYRARLKAEQLSSTA